MEVEENKNEGVYKKVIIIDDDPVTIFMSKKILLNFTPEFEILSFKTGLEAFEFLQQYPEPESTILLVDINMEHYSGWDFLLDYAKLNLNCRVFMFTSSIDLQDLEKSKTFESVLGFISKPLTPIKITKLLEESNR
jgi:response regulator RpfG family c-di-GMP phosphodiesterase